MNKLFFIVFIAFLIITAGPLFSEGSSETDDPNTLTGFHYLDQADRAAVDNFEALKARFAELHPEITIEWEYLVNEPYHNKLQTLVTSDQLPDIVFLWPGKRTGNVTGNGNIKDLSPWLEGNRDNFSVAAMAPQGQNGEIWELPEQVTSTHVMFTNDRLLEELGLSFPETMEELIEQGEVIREAGLIPIAMDNKDGWQMQSTFLSALVERTGGMEWYDRAAKGDAQFTDPEFIAALDVIKTLNDNDMFSPGINQAEYGTALTDFVNERAVYLIDGGWRTTNLTTELDDDLKPHISYNTFPDIPNQKGRSGSTAIVTGTGFGMNANLEGQKADNAWKWIWFYSGPEGSKIRKEFGSLPAYNLPADSNDPILLQKLGTFLSETPGGYVLDAVLDGEGMAVLHPQIQEMMFGNVTPEEAAATYEEWVAANDSSRK